MAGHFNAGNVWGIIVKADRGKNSNNKPYLNLEVNCSGAQGPIKAFGRLWGAEKIDGLQTAWSRNPGGIFRLQGFISQFVDGRDLTNFSFYSWSPAPDQSPRAAFVLRGEVFHAGFDGDDQAHLLGVTVVRTGTGGNDDKEEDFKLYVMDPAMLNGVVKGATVEAKGYLQKGAGEDEFGVATGMVRACCKIVKVVAATTP